MRGTCVCVCVWWWGWGGGGGERSGGILVDKQHIICREIFSFGRYNFVYVELIRVTKYCLKCFFKENSKESTVLSWSVIVAKHMYEVTVGFEL